jgi:hypothetical protein
MAAILIHSGPQSVQYADVGNRGIDVADLDARRQEAGQPAVEDFLDDGIRMVHETLLGWVRQGTIAT